jgi:hypothetical protein
MGVKKKIADLFYNYGIPLEGAGEWDESVFVGCVRLRADIASLQAMLNKAHAENTRLANEIFRLHLQLDYVDSNMGGYNS